MALCRVSKRVEEVILALDEKPRTRLELQAELEIGTGTVKKIVDWLIDKGLAEEKPVSRYKAEIRLTERGKHLANLIKEMHKIIEGVQ